MEPQNDHATACCAPTAPEAAGRLTRRSLLRGGVVSGAALAVVPRVAGGGTRTRRIAPDPVSHRAGPPPIVRRAEWGADETRRGPADYDAIAEKVVVHHTGTANGVSDWAEQLRKIYEYEVGSGYTDIAYHYLVAPDGRVYEGRWARDFGPGDAPNGEDHYGRLVRGGHALGHNSRTIGVALLGDYTATSPSAAAMESLVALVAWKCARWGIDPLGSGRYLNSSGGVEVLPNVLGHGDVRVTQCPGALLAAALPELRERVAARLGDLPEPPGGYWIVSRDGREVAFGNVPNLRTAQGAIAAPVSGVATHPRGRGYWAYGVDGGVFAFGEARFHGSLGGTRLNAPVVGLAPLPGGGGYWLAAADGGVFAFGRARFHGSLARDRLQAPVLGIEATPTGRGYWLFAADGGVFTFGDARFHGSLAHERLNAPIVDMAVSEQGYWLVGRDGGVFAFGDAGFFGSGGATAPVVSMVPSATRRGYLLLTADGHVLPFGDAPYHGSAAGLLPDTVGVAGAMTPGPPRRRRREKVSPPR